VSFLSFSSLEDMQKYIKESGDTALAAMSEEQRALTWGSYAMMPTDECVIFGYVFTEEELLLGELHAGASQEEAEATVRMSRNALKRGYLFGRWFSIIEPTGELGSNHAVNCWPITAEQHGIAATFGWDGRDIVRQPEGAWLLDSYIAMAHSRQADEY